MNGIEKPQYTQEEMELLGRLFPGDLFKRVKRSIQDTVLESSQLAQTVQAAVEARTNELTNDISRQEFDTLAGKIAALEGAISKTPQVNCDEICEQVCRKLLANRGFLIALNKVQNEGRAASAQNKKEKLAEIVGEIRGNPPGRINTDLIDSLYTDGVAKGKSEDWHNNVLTTLERRQAEMAQTINGLVLAKSKTQATDAVAHFAQLFVDQCVPVNDIQTVREAILSEDADGQLIPHLKKA